MAKTARKPILIVSGNPKFQNETREWAQLSSTSTLTYMVIAAKDGPEGASKILNQKFDLVIIDFEAPRLVNSDVLQHLTNKIKGTPPLIFINAQQMPKPFQESKLQGLSIGESPVIGELAKALTKSFSPPKSTVNYAVDARVLNALLKATSFVCGQYGVDKIELKKAEIKATDRHWMGDIGAQLPIQSRQFQGSFLISFEKSVYLQMLSSMLGEEQTSINDENSDAIGEISSMILGNAKSDFTEYDIKLTRPMALTIGTPCEQPTNSAQILIPANTPFGQMYIEVIAHPL